MLMEVHDARSEQAAAYGACINAKYLEVEKDMCKEQFTAFKECVTKAVSRDARIAALSQHCSRMLMTPLLCFGRAQMGRKW